MKNTMKALFYRARYMPVLPLGEDGRVVTGCEKHIALTRRAARESMVLLKNNGALPLAQGTKLAVFGIGQYAYEQGGTGAGIVYTKYRRSPLDGLLAKEAEGKVQLFKPLIDFYAADYEEQSKQVEVNPQYGPNTKYHGQFTTPEKVNLFGKETAVPDALVKEAAAFADTAIVCLSRSSGEFYDREIDRDFNITEEEQVMLAQVKANFKTVIVLLNVGAQMQCGWLQEDWVSSVLLLGTPGMEGGNAAAELLLGEDNPSGKLTDTWAREYTDYVTHETFNESPFFVNYEEDIFVGYRYFETIPGAAEKVVYPFGFGLSYTTFSVSVSKACEEDGKIVITAEVKNTGSVAGREVVQVYAGQPIVKLQKAAKNLVAFKKTKLLAPGESETLTLTVSPYAFASYDDEGVWQKSAYILEGGEYPIYVGTSVRDVTVCYTYTVAEDFRVLEQLKERCVCLALPRRLNADGTYTELSMKGVVRPQEFPFPAALTAKKPETLMKLDDVVRGNCTLDEFIVQMSNNDLLPLFGGKPSKGVAVTGGFGDNTKYGIPAFMTADAPCGIRARAEMCLNPTAFPTAQIMSCSWDEELVEECGSAIGLEIKENNMYAWLGPSMNIHRDPLGGRNFEYYSEDPVIAGKMAAAHVRGAQKHRISAAPKHFAANNKEWIRKECDSRVTERALREIYLKGFEICVKESDPKTVMTSYNPVNSVWASESADLQTWILRGEWGFDGLIMTDWNGHGRHGTELKAGSDIKMMTDNQGQLTNYLRDDFTGGMFRGDLEAAARRILKVFLWYEGMDVE